MIKKLAGLALLAALAAACNDGGTTQPVGGNPPTLAGTGSAIEMSPAVAVVGTAITFTSRGLFDHEQYARSWDFGDGETAEGASVSHIYQQVGTYQVVLTGSDGQETRKAARFVSVVTNGAEGGIPPQEVKRP